MTQPSSVLFIALFTVCLMTNGVAEENEAGITFYREKVYPVLQKNCFKCHGGGDELKGDFRLTSRAGLLHGGHYGSAYDAKDPASSVLLEMISYKDADHQMPPKGKLPDEARLVLAHWMEMGAPYDPALEINGKAVERRGFTVTGEDREWWAYR
ncbi:MAG: c-type cytochrome domain-containing protein, partial [Verrucomicrobiales bacterium]